MEKNFVKYIKSLINPCNRLANSNYDEITLIDCFSRTINKDTLLKKKNEGFVYGFFIAAESYNKELKNHEKRNLNFDPKEIIIEKEKYYPLYWGKSIAVEGRLKQHLNKNDERYKNTSALGIKNDGVLNNITIYFAAVFVNEYKAFEQYLHKKHPPILGSKTIGNQKK